ncbi:hypothetical protein [Alicyclobacillus fastidiosus]|uniref:Tail terminator n=1 Tax=Alicyclobacillus fastidiosus TaxID=392011 RepID=A0ABV5AK32_9BACL|nr:hypothetical protein [Alicyclobacillus fastidiosus]WEH09268.1 hypothetical protein PYS47_21765 [Alicyclobacillus fastidiosus]
MAKPDIEDVADQLISVFKDQFPDALSAVDSAKVTPLNPKPPLQWVFGDVQSAPQMPAMLFIGRETQEKDDNYQWRNQTYQFEIEAYVSSSDVQQLNRIVRRYGTAIDNVLRANQTLGGLSRNLTNINQKLYDSMKAPTGLFQVVAVSFNVTVITD